MVLFLSCRTPPTVSSSIITHKAVCVNRNNDCFPIPVRQSAISLFCANENLLEERRENLLGESREKPLQMVFSCDTMHCPAEIQLCQIARIRLRKVGAKSL